MNNKMFPRPSLRTDIALAIINYYWANTNTFIKAIDYNGKAAFKMKYMINGYAIRDFKKHLGSQTIKLVEENINSKQVEGDNVDEEDVSYWIYTIEGVDWSLAGTNQKFEL